MFSQWLAFGMNVFFILFLWLLLLFFSARVIRKSNDKSDRVRSVSAVDQKLLLSKFQGEN